MDDSAVHFADRQHARLLQHLMVKIFCKTSLGNGRGEVACHMSSPKVPQIVNLVAARLLVVMLFPRAQ